MSGYQPTNGLANTRTIAITMAIIGMDSIRPTEMNMVTSGTNQTCSKYRSYYHKSIFHL